MFATLLENFLPTEAFYLKTEFLWKIIIIIIAIKAIGELTKRLGQPSVFGKLLVGVILGPSILGFIPNEGPLWHTLKELSEIGVILLMFIAGLETDVEEFKKTAGGAFWVALLGVIVPLAAGYALTAGYGYKWTTALFVGTIMVATSVSISVQTLRELHRLQTREGFTILGAAVIDDILGLITLSLVVGIESGGAGGFATLFWVLLKVILFFAIAVIVGWLAFKPFFRLLSKFSVSMPVLSGALVVAFVYAVGAEFFGLAGIVGAYAAGIMLALTTYKNKILGEIEAMSFSFFVPIFFVSIGVAADIRGMSADIIVYTTLLTFLAVLTKVVGCGIGAWFSKFDIKGSLRVGIGMIARGEVALIVASYGLDHKIINNTLYSAMIVMAIVTTIVTPPLLRVAFKEKG